MSTVAMFVSLIMVCFRPFESQLKAELIRVTEERDTLAAQIKSDARMLENKVLAAKQQGIYGIT